MSRHYAGGPAFPVPNLQNDEDFNGMSLRDYFAAKAMQGIVAACGDRDGGVAYDETTVAASAYEMADAMLMARSA